MISFRQRLLVFLLLVLISACNRISPTPPEEKAEAIVFTPEASELIVPIEIPLSSLVNLAEKNFSGILYEDSDLNDDNIALKVWKNGKVKVSAIGNELSYQIPLKVWFKTALRFESLGINLGELKESEFSLLVKFRTRVNIDKTWKVETVTQSEGYEWVEKPEISIAGISIPVTPLADRIVKNQLSLVSSVIDQEAKRYLDIKAEVSEVWKSLHQPFQISSDPQLWLKVTPVSVSLSPLKGTAEKLSALIGVKIYSETVIGHKPNPTPVAALPSLEIGNYKGGYFGVNLITDISYKQATELAGTSLIGQTFVFGKKGKKIIKIEGLSMFPSAGKLAVKTDISGSLSGTIFLTGTPFFDQQSNKLILRDMDFDLETKNKLLKSADWLAHSIFVKKLAPYFEYDLSNELIFTRRTIQDHLKNKQLTENIVLNGNLEKLIPEKIFLTEESIKAVITANGKAEIKINGF